MRPPVPKTFSADSAANRKPLVFAIVCVCVTLVLYLILPRILEQITSSQPSHAGELFSWVKPVARPLLDARQDQSTDLRSAVQFLSCCAGLFAAYLWMLRLVRNDRSLAMQRFVFWAGATFLAVNFFSPVMLSTDVHAYAFYGRLVSHYKMDAYSASIPDSLASDPFLVLFGRGYVGSVYGPLWTLISAGITRLGGDSVAAVVLLFRGISAAAVLAGTWFICRILRRVSPGQVAQGMVLFLWNPLVILESAMSGHNDTVMAALLLFGIWLHVNERKTGAVAAFILSALVKFITGPLVPLYIWMVLRQLSSWRERIWFLARCILCSAALILTLFFLANVKGGVPAARFAGSSDFYTNNFHELIFKGLRRLLGEDAVLVEVPIYFQSWWFTTVQNGELYAAPEKSGRVLGTVEKNRKLLVLAPYRSNWVTVFDPVLRKQGFVSDDLMEDIDNDSGGYDEDPMVARLEQPPPDWSTVIQANLWIRRTCWVLFALFGLLAAWRTTNFDRFLAWSGAVMLALYFLIMTHFWPWYLIWALALVALKPENRPATLALFLSAGVLTLYVTIGYAFGDHEWIYTWRSIPAVILPAAVFLLQIFVQRKKA